MARVPVVVSVKWLAEALASDSQKIRVIDSSWHLPMAKRNARKEYYQQHIPGAVFFDLDDCCDKTTDIPHNLPLSVQFEQYVGNLGVSNEHHVVVYDNNKNFGIFSSQRLWWMFRAFGHDQVSVLDGGLPKWLEADYGWTDDKELEEPQIFKATLRPELVKNFNEVASNLVDKKFQLVDARSAGRFNGTAPEPRPDIKPGHIPGSLNIPFPSIMDPKTKTLKSAKEMTKVFMEAGVDLSQPIVGSCGSGVTACCIALAAFICGKEDVSIYDGAWVEWYLKAKPEQRIQVN